MTLRVLLIEDEDEWADALTDWYKRALPKAKVWRAARAADARRSLLEDGPWALVSADLNLGAGNATSVEGDGRELVRIASKLNEKPAVIVVSQMAYDGRFSPDATTDDHDPATQFKGGLSELFPDGRSVFVDKARPSALSSIEQFREQYFTDHWLEKVRALAGTNWAFAVPPPYVVEVSGYHFDDPRAWEGGGQSLESVTVRIGSGARGVKEAFNVVRHDDRLLVHSLAFYWAARRYPIAAGTAHNGVCREQELVDIFNLAPEVRAVRWGGGGLPPSKQEVKSRWNNFQRRLRGKVDHRRLFRRRDGIELIDEPGDPVTVRHVERDWEDEKAWDHRGFLQLGTFGGRDDFLASSLAPPAKGVFTADQVQEYLKARDHCPTCGEAVFEVWPEDAAYCVQCGLPMVEGDCPECGWGREHCNDCRGPLTRGHCERCGYRPG